MKIEIWSDFACPFCYIGETAMRMALNTLNQSKRLKIQDIEITYKSFQLDPNAVKMTDKNIHQYIADKYHITYEQAKAQNDNVVKMADAIGLKYDFDNIKRNNTALAHELQKYAAIKGLGNEMAHLLFNAYFENAVDIGDKDELINLASKLDFNLSEVHEVLDKRLYYGEVVKDQTYANQNQIQSVPLFIINNQYAITGAQSHVYFQRAFEQILEEK